MILFPAICLFAALSHPASLLRILSLLSRTAATPADRARWRSLPTAPRRAAFFLARSSRNKRLAHRNSISFQSFSQKVKCALICEENEKDELHASAAVQDDVRTAQMRMMSTRVRLIMQ